MKQTTLQFKIKMAVIDRMSFQVNLKKEKKEKEKKEKKVSVQQQ